MVLPGTLDQSGAAAAACPLHSRAVAASANRRREGVWWALVMVAVLSRWRVAVRRASLVLLGHVLRLVVGDALVAVDAGLVVLDGELVRLLRAGLLGVLAHRLEVVAVAALQ